MPIENTASEESQYATALLALATGDTSGVIEAQERLGQQQLMASSHLPATLIQCERADFEAVGFTLGTPDPKDPLFMPVTLPAGWTRQAGDTDLWSYIVDTHGRRRVSILYKAAFYDRRAHMTLTTVARYVHNSLKRGAPVILDDTWATPEAIAAVARTAIDRADRNVALMREAGHPEIADKHLVERALYEVLIDQHS
ncbi:hypothetical protein [Streptomyces sp. CAU 1734]|uniref:hypothetical protein n=1 Tax=Streptomyces sp. CAU 1734 TaxID=3140360 RepID=UPI003260864B